MLYLEYANIRLDGCTPRSHVIQNCLGSRVDAASSGSGSGHHCRSCISGHAWSWCVEQQLCSNTSVAGFVTDLVFVSINLARRGRLVLIQHNRLFIDLRSA